MDFSKVKSIVIPEGVVTKIVAAGKVIWQAIIKTFKNWVPFSTEADGKTIYNGGLGYQNGLRLSSTGVTKENEYSTATGFIPVQPGDIVRIYGVEWYSSSSNYLCVYDSSFTYLGACYGAFKMYGSSSTFVGEECAVLNATDALIKLAPAGYSKVSDKIAYVRVSSIGVSGVPQHGANMIVTVNEEIVNDTTYTNVVPLSIGSDGKPFNNGLGYYNGQELSGSSGSQRAGTNSTCTGFIPVKQGDVIRIKGCNWYSTTKSNYIIAYTSSFGHWSTTQTSGTHYYNATNNPNTMYIEHDDYGGRMDIQSGVSTIVIGKNPSIYDIDGFENIAYIRISVRGDGSNTVDGADLIVTVNEEIT